MARLSTASAEPATSANPTAETAGTTSAHDVPSTSIPQTRDKTADANNDDNDGGPKFNFENFRKRYPTMVAPVPFDPTLLPKGSRSLTSISAQAFGCGFVLAASLLLVAHFVLEKDDTIWRLPAFTGCLALLHFLEFYITARWNLPAARASSFLLNNGLAYNIAHTCAVLEILATRFLLPAWYGRLGVWTPWTIGFALAVVAVGQVTRSVAMAQAGTNFNHTPVQKREEGHVLVTHGFYQFSRHPSYFGFFWWTLGTQLLVGNKICLAGYAYVLWSFFSHRIKAEERTLVQFFGDDYRAYQKRVGTLIPFVK
ncbi:hypothetical protein LTR62_006167 [Meristemomyces frigidus]|uniref:Protein-S-isoprenylcysteine O-methyltransferase n=1 Tax=Meristemomyces frigidus TaxID=1508187 RepID=A0AAN7TCT0_9PEZI|nr:hypothetical protein LTR62_006167 [Meristemomyces frigidus]